MKTCTYRITYFSTCSEPWYGLTAIYVEANEKLTRNEIEKLCSEKVRDFSEIKSIQKINVVKL